MIVGILGPAGCGGTFIDWSLHYLSGKTNNWVIECDQKGGTETKACIQQIVDNPLLSNATAHGHKKCHPSNKLLPVVIDILKQQPLQDLYTFYHVEGMDKGQTETSYHQIINRYSDLKFINYEFQESDIDIIFGLQCEKLTLSAIHFDKLVPSEITTDYLEKLAPWDQRELLSLFYPKCIRGQTINEKKQTHTNSIAITGHNMFYSLPDVIDNIFEFLNLPMDLTKKSHWEEIYQHWKKGNDSNFYQDLNYIVDSIVNNRFLDLSQYNMTFVKEIIIASKLLYNYNLALRANGMSRIPLNTRAWHEILELNVYHNLTK